ncbi:carbohydrate ABC transporter permease [Neglectibacter timonensis]|uniref:Carbohydrate ABC transporter permease n=2 Tax=Neglectibacter timonensis TaxID=1776382 RepID=A0ABT1S4J7_9FIRM|nr:carbohydrate ABC transporter permease [Neglectibacter timonensis]MCQ4841855.1 carbohydrate ABC transporter permease [Neglectibacter timonensis]MCQ4845466.1 carbohydrate ABC transporter permease [Neglectibacter timonensis]
MMQIEFFKNKLMDTVVWLIVILMTLCCLLPLLNTLAISFSNNSAANANQVGILPVGFTLSSYKKLLEDNQFWRSAWISVLRVVLGTGLNMLMMILLAYPLSKSKNRFASRDIYMKLVIFAMLFNGGLIPGYIIVSKLHLLNTIWALVLPGAVPVFNVILLMNFMKGLPEALEEAAVIDGASEWTILTRVVLPISKPGLATVALFCIVNHWNDYFQGLIYMRTPSKYPLQTYIQQLTIDVSQIADPQQLIYFMTISTRTLNAAKIVVATVPLLVIYPFLQRYFVTGIVIGAVKE